MRIISELNIVMSKAQWESCWAGSSEKELERDLSNLIEPDQVIENVHTSTTLSLEITHSSSTKISVASEILCNDIVCYPKSANCLVWPGLSGILLRGSCHHPSSKGHPENGLNSSLSPLTQGKTGITMGVLHVRRYVSASEWEPVCTLWRSLRWSHLKAVSYFLLHTLLSTHIV
jgi:hypothetical protein